MKTVGCKGSDANLYGLSNILGNGNFSTNSLRKESDSIFTITNIFAKCLVLTGSHVSLKSVWSPSAQLGKMFFLFVLFFFMSSETDLLKDLCPLCHKSPVRPLSPSQAPPHSFPSSLWSSVPGAGQAGCPPASLCQGKHTRAGPSAALWLTQPSQAPSGRNP